MEPAVGTWIYLSCMQSWIGAMAPANICLEICAAFILETIFTLEKLGYKDLDLLKCFLAITRGTPEEKLFVLRFLRDGGFIDESSSFVQNNRATKLQSLSDLAFTHTEQD